MINWNLPMEIIWGMLLGGLYFGGLWLNVKRISESPIAVWFVPVSFLIRIAVVLAGIYWMGKGKPLSMIAILVGVILMRQVVIAAVTKKLEDSKAATSEVLS